MTWRVSQEYVELFRHELWKDERSFRGIHAAGSGEFLKDCFDARRTEIELKAIQLLSASPGEPLCPQAQRYSETVVSLQKILGIRLFDLIRILRELELADRDGLASAVITKLLQRQRLRLGRIQSILYAHSADLAASSYPMDSKLSKLLYLLAGVFRAEALFSTARADIAAFAEYWASECCVVPFRDATPKNCIVGDPRLDPCLFEDDAERIAALRAILLSEPSYGDNVPLWDVDFSSVEHLTAPEDDPISLHCHEWTDGSSELSADALLLLEGFSADAYRTAAALMVRFLRFGGRKLAYKVINAQGFEVRFRYDEPLFYFENISDKCSTLSPSFVREFEGIFSLIEDIRYRASNPSAADEALLRVDHFRRYFPERAEYWQENPSERSGRPTNAI